MCVREPSVCRDSTLVLPRRSIRLVTESFNFPTLQGNSLRSFTLHNQPGNLNLAHFRGCTMEINSHTS